MTDNGPGCPECGLLSCVCYDDGEQDEAEFDLMSCGKMEDGTCMLAGTEFCDWECPLS